MDICATFIADPQPAVLVQPSDGPLHDPTASRMALFALLVLFLLSDLADVGNVVMIGCRLATRGVVVPLVQRQVLRLFRRRLRPAKRCGSPCGTASRYETRRSTLTAPRDYTSNARCAATALPGGVEKEPPWQVTLFHFTWRARRDGGPAPLTAVPLGPLSMRLRESPTSNHATRGC